MINFEFSWANDEILWGKMRRKQIGMCIHIHTRVYANTCIPVVAGAGAGAVVGAGRATLLMVK